MTEKQHEPVSRYLKERIQGDLRKKMVFIGGPRQVGKTTLALDIAGSKNGYLNWDADEHREKILLRQLPETPIWIFDEIHKYRKWRQFLKGLFDLQGKERRILVTGSARLDYYRYGGDSLQGRYHFWRLHPLSVTELKITSETGFRRLMDLGGFPEPYFGSGEIEARRWSREYRTRLIQDDIASLEQVRDMGTLENLVLRLPDLVGAPLSINALSEDLQVNHATIRHWIEILERMYAIFRIPPFGAPKIRASKKEQKHYHFDWTLVTEPGLRFENLMACHLLKWVHYLQDSEGRDVDLRFFRGADRGEVDFVILERSSPFMCVECKNSTRREIHPSLRYFKSKFPSCKAYQIHAEGEEDYVTDSGIMVQPAFKFLSKLI